MRFRILKKHHLLSVFVLVVRLGIGCMFIISSLPKIRQPYDFLAEIYGYELVGPKVGVFIAITLPWLELFVGVCLVGGVIISGALLSSIGMTVVFTFAIASALYRGLDISCGCFHTSSAATISYSTLIRACTILLFSATAYCGVVIPRRPIPDDDSLSKTVGIVPQPA